MQKLSTRKSPKSTRRLLISSKESPKLCAAHPKLLQKSMKKVEQLRQSGLSPKIPKRPQLCTTRVQQPVISHLPSLNKIKKQTSLNNPFQTENSQSSSLGDQHVNSYDCIDRDTHGRLSELLQTYHKTSHKNLTILTAVAARLQQKHF